MIFPLERLPPAILSACQPFRSEKFIRTFVAVINNLRGAPLHDKRLIGVNKCRAGGVFVSTQDSFKLSVGFCSYVANRENL